MIPFFLSSCFAPPLCELRMTTVLIATWTSGYERDWTAHSRRSTCLPVCPSCRAIWRSRSSRRVPHSHPRWHSSKRSSTRTSGCWTTVTSGRRRRRTPVGPLSATTLATTPGGKSRPLATERLRHAAQSQTLAPCAGSWGSHWQSTRSRRQGRRSRSGSSRQTLAEPRYTAGSLGPPPVAAPRSATPTIRIFTVRS